MKTRHSADRRLSQRASLVLFAFAVFVLTQILASARPASAAPAGRVVLAGHTAPLAVKGLVLAGRLTATNTLSLDLVLPLRNQADLQDLLRRQADPADALYGKYLTPAQFADRFGPDMADVSAVASFAKAQGLSIREISANRTTIHVTGPVSAIEAAFGVRMQSYVGKGGEAFYAPDAEPTVPSALSDKLMAVVGLTHVGNGRAFSHAARPRPSSQKALPDYARPVSLANYSGNAGLAPYDIQTVYNLTNVSSTGTGQTLALYELSTYTASDIAEYEHYYSIPNIPLQNVGVDGFDTGSAPNNAAGEVTLDIEMFLALAPSASKIIVYENTGTSNSAFEKATLDIFTRFATDDLASVLSVSYGISEFDITSSEASANNQELMQIEAQGQTVCVASGDAGAYTDQSQGANENPNTSEPGSQPLVTGVGGTDLEDSADYPFTYVAETSWADTGDSGRGPIGTGGGGGISEYWSLPSYQSGSFSTSVNPQGSTTSRNVPDVSLYGDYDDGGYDVYFTDPTNGPGWSAVNGTSAACPLWAAFLADVNQGRRAAGKANIGLANTAIYAIAKSSRYASDFHDINDNSNNLYYNAVTGYDNSTGWGSFNGINLYNDLVSYGAAAVGVRSLSFNPSSAHPGDTITGTVTLTGAAPAGGAVVTISENGSSVGTVTVAAGNTTVNFGFTLGTGTGTIPFAATYNGSTANTTVTVTAATPTITSFTPTSGPVGTSVTITGTNLTGASSVKFHGTAATSYTVNSATQVTASVPSGATTGTISVTTSSGTATSSASFTVTTMSAPPTITSFSPTSGPVGTSVVITGTNFTGATTVGFTGAHASFTVNSATQITATVPSGAQTGTIAVATPSGTAHSSASFTVTTVSVPTITSFSPTSGPVGTSVTITGTNLTGATAVKFHGTATTTFHVASATQITATVPSGATTGTITVTTAGGTATSSASFTVTTTTGPPTITSFSPTSGPVGTTVVITGTNLTGTTVVGFTGAHASFTVNSATQITATVPSGAATGTIAVGTPAGTAHSTGTFTVTTVAAPTITGFTPTSGPIGTSVMITGTNFTGASSVKFHGTAATFHVASATSITATVPSGATTGTISVTTSAGTATSSASFTVTTTSGPPTITSFSPTSGPVGTSVVLTGTNFTGATVVGFTGAHASFTVNSSTQITTTVPSGAATGTIAVATPSGTAKSTASFTVTTGGSGPTITSFSPTSGHVGDTVVITGTGFATTTGLAFNGVAASGSIDSNTQLTATVPTGATTGKITVTTSAGTATSSANFTVLSSSPPTITSFTPTSGSVGTSVTITGTNFTGATSVKFNGTTATYTVGSATQVTATVPSGATTGKITVTTSAGTATSSATYTVTF